MSIRGIITDMCEDAVFLAEEKFDAAIIGLAERFGGVEAVAYDAQKVLAILEEDLGSMDDAIDWYEYNIIGAWMGEKTPIFITLAGEEK
jgi:hypothetical protein